MRSLILTFSLLIGLLLIEIRANATHVVGAEITYKQVDTKKFRFDFIFYRDCNGVPFSNPSAQTFLKCKNKSSLGVNLTLLSIKRIDLANDSSCLKTNTYNQGAGVEAHQYYCIIDFDSSPYISLYNCGETLIMETGQCCRNYSDNLVLPDSYFYTFAELNLNSANYKNSSPVFSTQPIVFLQGNQSIYQTFNAMDTIDNDSLSYSFSPIKTSYTADASYKSGYSYNQPLKVYYPGSLKFPYNNKDAKPVIGIYFDPFTGDLAFTPVKFDDITIYVVEVTEWRKDTTNKYIKIGSIRREIMGIARSNAANFQPEISVNKLVHYITEGATIQIDFKVNDNVAKQPPPNPSYPPDSVTLTWSSATPGASFTIAKDSTTRESATFRWTAPKGSISNKPYTFVVTAKDNASGFYGIASRTYSIYVIDTQSVYISNIRLGCDGYELKCSVDTSNKSLFNSLWEVLDANLKRITDSAIVTFNKSHQTWSNDLLDTVQIKRNGKYYIKHTYGKSQLNNPIITFDSIELKDIVTNLQLNSADTTLCPGDSILLKAQTDNNDKFTYSWRVSDDSSWQNSDSIVGVGDLKPSENKTYSLKLENQMGCSASAQINIHVYASFPLKLNKTYTKCANAFQVIEIGENGYHSFVWNNQNGTNTYEPTRSETILLRYKDVFDCQFYDTLQAIVNPIPKIELGEDTAICSGSLQISVDTVYKAYWNTNDTSNSITTNKSGTFSVKATDLNGCIGMDTIMVIIHPQPPTPRLTITNDTIWSDQQGNLTWYKDDVFYKNTDSNYLVLTEDGAYTVDYQDSNGCNSDLSNQVQYIKGGVFKSTIPFKIYPNPNNGKFYVELAKSQIQQIKKIELYDMVGKKVLFSSNIRNNTIEISNHSISGSFIIDIELENGERIRQMVVFQK